ncbi:MAG: hypothetical protein Q8M71_06760 [Thermodesulfovibrionales bacterium]|nr:hypothetical protein [Thermodesulfovibrionales bacterium]
MKWVYCSLLIFTLFIWTNVFAGDAPVFTNDNLEKYSKQKPMVVREEPKESDSKSDFKDEQKQPKSDSDKEYYCKKASELRRKIESTKKGIGMAIAEKKISPNGLTSTDIGALRAKHDEAVIELKDLEQEAHEKGIPPGWLRCQY